MQSPFLYEAFATDKQFFGREDELKKIFSYTATSNNLLIYSLRRYGKSSLIKEYMRRDRDVLSIYIDVYNITSAKEFATLLLKSIVKVQKGSVTQTLKRLSKMFSRTSFEIAFDPNTAKSNIVPKIKDMDFEEALDEAFGALFAMSKTQKIVLAIDEFQQISIIKDIKIDAILRKYMQENKTISYIFLGSKRHTLTELFQYKAPLYEMATHFELGCIKEDDFITYIQKYLKMSDELILYIINIARCETKLVQHICHILYVTIAKKTIKKEDIDEALKEIILSKDSSYSMVYDNFSLTKKKAFKILVSSEDMYKQEILEHYSISKQALLSAFKALYKEEIIDKNDNRWLIPDRTFELWGRDILGRK